MGQGGKLGKLDGMGDSGAQKIRYQERIWRMGRNPVWFGYFVYFTFLHLVIIAFCGDTVISLNFGTQFEEIVAQKYSPFHYNMCFFYSCMFFLGSNVLHTKTSYVYHICYVHGNILEASDLAEGRGSSS